jgi:hypothetical protein
LNFKKVSELENPHQIVFVSDPHFRNNYFVDCEVVGWVLVEEENGLGVYHLYQRAWDEETGQEIPEQCIFFDKKLTSDEERSTAIRTLLHEAKLQEDNKEKLAIFTDVTKLLQKN